MCVSPISDRFDGFIRPLGGYFNASIIRARMIFLTPQAFDFLLFIVGKFLENHEVTVGVSSLMRFENPDIVNAGITVAENVKELCSGGLEFQSNPVL